MTKLWQVFMPMHVFCATTKIQKVVAKLAPKTIPYTLSLCIVQLNKASKWVNWCEQQGLG